MIRPLLKMRIADRARWAAPFVVALLWACGESEGPVDPPDGLFEVQLGSAVDAMRGTGGFRTVDNLEALPLRPGSQGGLHVYINMRISDTAAENLTDNPVVYREARRISDGRLVSRLEHRTRLVASSTVAGFETEKSISLFLCPTPVGVDVADVPLELTVELKADYQLDTLARGQLRFVPFCPTEDAEFCLDICIY